MTFISYKCSIYFIDYTCKIGGKSLEENNCKISEAEWRVIRVVWDESPLNTTQIINRLKSETSWSPKTIHSLISRLIKKGALGVDKLSSPHQFYPIVLKEDCIKEETGSFIQKVYDGSYYQMVANFISNEKMSKNEIEYLKKILEEKSK